MAPSCHAALIVCDEEEKGIPNNLHDLRFEKYLSTVTLPDILPFVIGAMLAVPAALDLRISPPLVNSVPATVKTPVIDCIEPLEIFAPLVKVKLLIVPVPVNGPLPPFVNVVTPVPEMVPLFISTAPI